MINTIRIHSKKNSQLGNLRARKIFIASKRSPKSLGVWEFSNLRDHPVKPPIKKRAWISVPFLSRKLTYVCEIIWSLDEFSIIEACRVIIMACSTLNIVTIPYLY